MMSETLDIRTNRILKISQTDLKHCFGVICQGIPLIRSEDVDSLTQGLAILKLAEECRKESENVGNYDSLRMSSMQLDWIDEDWDLIQKQHFIFLKMHQQYPSFKVAHISFPSEYAYLRRNPHDISEFRAKPLQRLCQQFNYAAWLQYASWLNEGVEKILQTFRPEASEEYQLQGILEDLGHEIHSHLLSTLRESIVDNILAKEDAVIHGKRELVYPLEKAIIVGREQLRGSIETICMICSQITEGVKKIESMHPELIPLKYQTQLLYTLMQIYLYPDQSHSWGKRLLLIQLLDESLGVISLVNSDMGIDRANLVFSIRLALIELKNRYYFEDRFRLSMEYDVEESYPEMRKELAALALANLKELGIPSSDSVGQIRHLPTEQWGSNPDLRSFFPLK